MQVDVYGWFPASKIEKKVLNFVKEVIQMNIDCQLIIFSSIWLVAALAFDIVTSSETSCMFIRDPLCG